MSQKIYIAQAVIVYDDLCYEDGDRGEITSFLGAHTTPERAMAFLQEIHRADRQAENDLRDECEAEEPHMPDEPLEFEHGTDEYPDPSGTVTRERWVSNPVRFAHREMGSSYIVFESRLDPVL